MMSTVWEMAFWLLAGHAAADFAFQTRWMTTAKNHLNKVSEGGFPVWPLALGAHSLIHGAVVALATGSVVLGCLETVSHALIDYFKSDGRYGFYADQALHLALKALWLWMAVSGIA